MHEQILELLKSDGELRAGDAIQAVGSPPEIARRYEQLVLDLYWKAKDLPATVRIANLGLNYCQTIARGAPDVAVSGALFDSAKKIAYNLASFCWPGWDEPGITIGETEFRAGDEAARLNLRLAVQLKRPRKGMSMAHWMLGAYLLAQGKFAEAKVEFESSTNFANQAEEKAWPLAVDGYRALAQIGQKDAGAASELDRVLAQLEAINNDDSREYIRQLGVARKVFGL